jgi:putative ABC transport system permease protein
MLKNIFITAIRNLLKHKGYLFINIIGLAIGLASFIFITFYVIHELSWDRFHSQHENIYRLVIKGQMSGQDLHQAISAAPTARALIDDYPEIEKVVRIAEFGAWLIRYQDKRFNEDGILFADSTFFDIFDFKLVRGNPETALLNPRSMVLTETFAEKYFGSEDPMGKSLSVEEDTIFYTVTGIIENIPEISHFQFDMIGSMNSIRQSRSDNWVSHNYYTYMVIKEGTSIPELEDKLQHMVVQYVGPQIKEFLGITLEDFKDAGNYFGYYLQPLTEIHLKSNLQEEIEPNGNIAYIYIFSLIAIFILLIAIINFVNLSTARSSTRAKEVGVRKVTGATRQGLIFQFLAESLLLTIIAAAVAVILVELLSPAFNILVGKDISIGIFNNVQGILLVLLLVGIVGILAGLYPSFVLAAFKPATVLKGTFTAGAKSGWLRSILVVIQFTISIAIIIGTLVVYFQLDYMQNKNLGFNKEQLVVVRRPDALDDHLETFKQELLKNPAITGVANSTSLPGKEYNNNGMLREDDPDKNLYLLFQNRVSFEYPKLMGFELVEGRFFSKEYGTDSNAIILNETAVRVLGLKNPVGKKILQPGNQDYIRRPIIGIIKDWHVESLHKRIEPACLTIMPGNWEGYLTIRINTSNLQETVGFIEDSWQQYTSKQPFQYFFFDEEFNTLYQSEVRTGRIFAAFAILAIFIACLGLLGLIAFTSVIRTKEIGIRKALGAGVPTIIRLLSKEVLWLILISTLIAWPLAWFGTRYWLQSFADQIEVSPFIYILATLTTLLIGWLAISFQAIKAAMLNPVEALKYE